MEAGPIALLHIDMQYIHVHPDYTVSGANQPVEAKNYVRDRLNKTVIPNIKRLLEAFRFRKRPLVHIVFNHVAPDGSDLDPKIYERFTVDPKRGNWAIRTKDDPLSAVIEEIAPLPGETVLEKTTYSAFESTNLQFVLTNHKVRQVILVGGLTDCCVKRTALSARDQGYYTIGVPDACIAWSEENHNAGLRDAAYSETKFTDEALALIM